MEFLEEMEYVGDIPEGWKWVKLGEMAEIIKKTYLPNNKENLKYIGLEHIEEGKLRLNSIGISSEVKSTKYLFKAGDILFGKLRPYFRKVVKVNFDGVCSTDIWVIVAKQGVDQSYLFYFLANWDFINLATYGEGGTRMPRADWNFLKQIEFPLPPLPEQKAIADVLSSIDDKIELLHRQNKTLEEMAMTLFRQWFIEPTKDGLPEGWEEKALDEIAEFLNGIPSQKYPGDKLPVIKIKEMREGITENSDYCNNNIPKKYLVNSGDILFSWSGSLEVVIWFGGIGVLNQHIFKVTSLEYPKWFCYLSIKQHIAEFRAIAESKTTTMGHIQREHLSNTNVFIPPKIFFENYNKAITPIFDKIIANTSQIQTLEKLRDTLLPKLMSGEIRVKI